jgi:hypothetical protein
MRIPRQQMMWKSEGHAWLFNWESMAIREMESLKIRCVGSSLVAYGCLSLLSLMDAKGQLLCPVKG